VHCGVDPADYEPRPRERAPGDPLRVLTVARLEPRKGQEVLLEAVAQLRRDGHEVSLEVVGDGPARERAERRAEELGIAGSVTFAGAVDRERVADHYARADVFCLPSFAEGVPVVLMEAMASGLPVVATQVMGIPELVQDGRTGRLVPPGRADALATALRELAADGDLVARLGEAARRRVVQDYALADSAAALEALFRRTAAVTPGPAPRRTVPPPG
jgi:glycosyltransferase involved in cell wall biosynthesis